MRSRTQAAMLVTVLSAAAGPALAKQPNPSSEALQVLPPEHEGWTNTPNSRISNETSWRTSAPTVASWCSPAWPWESVWRRRWLPTRWSG